MRDELTPDKNLTLYVCKEADDDMICKVSRALALPERIEILRSILYKSKSVSEIAKELDIPVSSVARHIEVLSDAQLIITNYYPGIKGHAKYCSQTILSYTISLDMMQKTNTDSEYTIELPIGYYSHCHIKAPCGMNGKDSRIGEFDDPRVFFMPEHIHAEQLWFDRGFISYNFPSPSKYVSYSSISFSFEICSETPYYNNNWPSDITLYINNVELLTFTSPGDFGGRRGKYTPKYWPISSTQYGLIKKLTVNKNGVYLDSVLLNKNVKFDDLALFKGNAIQFTIGIKDDAIYKGGINLFGKNFGDYPQAIVMTII